MLGEIPRSLMGEWQKRLMPQKHKNTISPPRHLETDSHVMRKLHLFAFSLGVLAATAAAHGQQSTNTNCTINGNNTSCNSQTTDYSAQQQRSYQEGQQIGSALGQGLAAGMQAHAQTSWVKKYCAAHPGKNWKWFRRSDGQVLSHGHCPSDSDKGVEAANTFMAHHRDLVPCEANSVAITSYLQSHNLDPREEKSYERAFKQLKKDGQLNIYSKT